MRKYLLLLVIMVSGTAQADLKTNYMAAYFNCYLATSMAAQTSPEPWASLYLRRADLYKIVAQKQDTSYWDYLSKNHRDSLDSLTAKRLNEAANFCMEHLTDNTE